MAQVNVGTRRTFQETSMAASCDHEMQQPNRLSPDHHLISEQHKDFLATNSIESCKNCKFCPAHNHHKRPRTSSDEDEKQSPHQHGKDGTPNAVADVAGCQ